MAGPTPAGSIDVFQYAAKHTFQRYCWVYSLRGKVIHDVLMYKPDRPGMARTINGGSFALLQGC